MDDKPIIIDCDTGRDDALAIWIAQSGKLNKQLCGVVTSYGNVTINQVTQNTLRVLGLAGRNDVPVLKGASLPLRLDHRGFTDIIEPRQQKIGNGLCNVELPETSRPFRENLTDSELADHIKKFSEKNGALDYFITGPGTNFSATCDVLGDEIYNVINQVVIVAGKMDDFWEKVPGADFNLAADPFAIANILKTKLPVTFIPMDTTWHINMHVDAIKELTSDTPISQKAQEIMIAYCEDFSEDRVFRFHDPVALFADNYKDSFKTLKLGVVTDEEDSNFGRLTDNAPQVREVKVFMPDSEVYSEICQEILDTLGLTKA